MEKLNIIPLKNLKAISLFSGAGGDTLGMINAGVDVIGFVENNKFAIDTHLKNFPNLFLIEKNIEDVSFEHLEKYIGNIDYIFGGFPCQSFSHAGKKNSSDMGGHLYKHFVRITNIIKPKVILGENVKGILTRKTESNELFIDRIIK